MEMLAIFRGKVQGVGFRFFTEKTAKKMGLTGYVRNREDGAVEVCVQGSEDDLEELIQELEKEFHGIIERVEKQHLEEKEHYDDFSISP